jgi:hypothetical protein
MFAEAFGERYIEGGVGSNIKISTETIEVSV